MTVRSLADQLGVPDYKIIELLLKHDVFVCADDVLTEVQIEIVNSIDWTDVKSAYNDRKIEIPHSQESQVYDLPPFKLGIPQLLGVILLLFVIAKLTSLLWKIFR